MSHPNIIELIDAPVVEGPNFALALPLAELGSLNNAIDQLNDRTKKIVAYQVACGVAYYHSRGIGHRDLKPQNVLIFSMTLSPIAKLADFGTPLVNSCIHEPHQTEITTTLWYRSPEGILDQPYTYSNDVWALGVIIYEIFAGGHFIKAYSRVEMLLGYISILGTPPKNIIVSMAIEEEELRLQDPGPTNESLGVKRGELERAAKRIARRYVEYP